MNKRHSIVFLILALVGGVSFGLVISPLLSSLIPGRVFSPVFWAIVFIGCTFWLLHGIQKEVLLRDRERMEVEEHRRKKRSAILRLHPLQDPVEKIEIRSSSDFELFFESHSGEVSDMDYDENGRSVFADHVYYWM